MASEINVNATLNAQKGSIALSRTFNKVVNWTVARNSAAVQNIAAGGTAGVALTVNASVTTFGWAYFNNLDAANFIEIGVQVAGTFYPLVRMEAGEPAFFRLAQGITLYARANTAAVDLEFGILNN